jgi:DNA-directed RNA polymerase specialized sigma24 family protein
MKWLRAGDARREFERFVADSADPLLRTGYLMACDLTEAEDLVQETLLRVARRWNRVRSMDHPAAYARRVLVNLAIDATPRRAHRRDELGMASAAGPPAGHRHAHPGRPLPGIPGNPRHGSRDHSLRRDPGRKRPA